MYQQLQPNTKKRLNYKSVVAVLCVLCTLLLISDIGLIVYVLKNKNGDLNINDAYTTYATIYNAIEEQDLAFDDLVILAQVYKDQGLLADFEMQDDHIIMEAADGVTFIFTAEDMQTQTDSNLIFAVVNPAEESKQKEDLSFFDKLTQGRFIRLDGHIIFTLRFGPILRTNLRVADKNNWKQYAKAIRNREMIAGRDYFYICPSFFRNHLQVNALHGSVLFLRNDLCVRDNRLLNALFDKGLGMVVVMDQAMEEEQQNELSDLLMQQLAVQDADGSYRSAQSCVTTVLDQFSTTHPDFTGQATAVQLYFPDGTDDFSLTEVSEQENNEQPTTQTNTETQNDASSALTVEEAKSIAENAYIVFNKWLCGGDYDLTQEIKIGNIEYPVVKSSKEEMKAEICQYLHESYFDYIFDSFYIEQDGILCYKIGGLWYHDTYSVVQYDLQQRDNKNILSMTCVHFNPEFGTAATDTLIKIESPQLEFVKINGNWVINEYADFIDMDFLFSLVNFLPQEGLTNPETLHAPQEAFLCADDISLVALKTEPAQTAENINSSFDNNEKLYICGYTESISDWVFVCHRNEFGWLQKEYVSSADELSSGKIIDLFTKATALYRDWINWGPLLDYDNPSTYTINGKTNDYAKVQSNTFFSVDEMKESFAKYFSKELYEHSISELYTMVDGELYGVTSLGRCGDISGSSIKLTITSQTETECTFSVTEYYSHEEIQPHTNNYKLKKINGSWVFVDTFHCINSTYSPMDWIT